MSSAVSGDFAIPCERTTAMRATVAHADLQDLAVEQTGLVGQEYRCGST